MFEREKVELYVQSVRLVQDKDEKTAIEMDLYITPIDYELACEVDKELAEAMFHRLRNGTYKPRLVMPRASFIIPEIELQNMSIFPLKEKAQDKLGAQIANVLLSNVHARRLFPEDEGMSLIFRASIPYDSHSLALAARYFRQKMYVTFTEVQQSLPLETQGTNPLCEECNMPAKWIDVNGKTLCKKHVRAGEGEVKEIGSTKPEKQKARSGKDAAAGRDDDGPAAA